ncbi:MAG: CRISPR-associated endonuclease Cas3'' [Proteobacteria bacterium]|nr:MAG: CRISPR-associated endonuclease Cas3'' [Pseudomonadota bacterium]
MPLRVEDFDAFHLAVHGTPPFPWQKRLIEQVDARRAWPRVLDLPTGVGKTTCIDIALFALALDAARAPEDRWCARRIAMVVDRRVVVDQAAERGRLLLRKLTEATSGIAADVAAALRSLAGEDEEPLGVYTLRGGIVKDDGWARTPHQPLILASTVDQLGSRLLIQGYGVSRSMKPVHAGLLGTDTLILLDEVHLSQPFAETLENLGAFRPARERPQGVRPLQWAMLSATPGDVPGELFRLDEDERAPASPLGRRLHASKPARLAAVSDREALIASCVHEAASLIERHAVVAIVVNRVAAAQAIESAMRRSLNERADVLLLTGRMRPLDRDDLLDLHRGRLTTGRDRGLSRRTLVVVATQCIEAGADFDFDALVTESASFDALRQRFGRLDRAGAYGRSEAVVLHVKDGANDDPIYGPALPATWNWLNQHAAGRQKIVDFGTEACPIPSDVRPLAAPRARAPVLLPAYLDLWMQTSPEPAVVPDVSLFLHGPDSGPADVQVVWRVDLLEEHLNRDDGSATAIVEAVRPSALEAVSVPFAAARRWLAEEASATEFADVPCAAGESRSIARSGRRVLRWRGGDSEVVDAAGLRPGDTIVVPALRGGLSSGTFDPSATAPVVDLAERAAFLARGRPVLRLHPSVVTALSLGGLDSVDDLRSAARAAAEAGGPPWRIAWLGALAGRLRRTVVEVGGDLEPTAWTIVEAPRLSAGRLRAVMQGIEGSVEHGADTTSDEEDSYHVGRTGITLSRHSADVERFARRYADLLCLPKELASDVALAAWLHDVGKADPRFQLLLRGGDEIELFVDETPWAKSGMPSGAKQAQDLAWRRSGYPRGARHEVQSIAMIEAVRDQVAEKAHDLDLVLHLVGSHHGYCRPFAPPVQDHDPVEVLLPSVDSPVFGEIKFAAISSDNRLHRVDSPLADRFWSLVERYGWLELCWLEAILRLADHRASEEEERGGEEP